MDPTPTFAARTRLTNAQKFRVWLVLARASNLPTVWSNCIAGCWLGGWNTPSALLLLCLSATLLYSGGMFLNDACDVAFDSQCRIAMHSSCLHVDDVDVRQQQHGREDHFYVS